jgi:glycosyltransferase involved in cell wall biosynthesis
VSASRFPGELEVVAHGADVRMLLALPSAFRTHVMARVIAMSTRIRFAAHASYQALTASLPEDLQDRLQQRVEVRPADIVLPDVSSAAKELRKVHGDGHLAVTVARLVPSKRVDLAIEAVHRLSPEVRLGVIGDGPDRGRLARLRGADLVRFEGMLPRERALAWIAAADVLVHTSEAEAAPTVIREARLLGTPVVACDAGDVALWARHDHGIACVRPDADAVASAMRRIVRGQAA